jgi:hypothetical protein
MVSPCVQALEGLLLVAGSDQLACRHHAFGNGLAGYHSLIPAAIGVFPIAESPHQMLGPFLKCKRAEHRACL